MTTTRGNASRSVGLLTAAMMLIMFTGAGQARAAFNGTFTLTASASFTTVEYFESRTPAQGDSAALAAASPSSALATLDSLGTSAAFASAPYPGPTVVSLPGTVAGFTDGQVSPPGYPTYVSSNHPTTPEERQEAGPYLLAAASTASSSSGEARTGIDSDAGSTGSSRGAANTRIDGDQAIATAEASGGAVNIDVIRIGDINSSATVTVGPTGDATPSTTFSIAGLTVAGTGFELTADGLVLAGTAIPIDSTPAADVLAQADIQLSTLKPETGTSDDGSTFARSGALQIRRSVAGPDGGRSTLVYTFGQSLATASATAFEPTAPPGDGSFDFGGGTNRGDTATGGDAGGVAKSSSIPESTQGLVTPRESPRAPDANAAAPAMVALPASSSQNNEAHDQGQAFGFALGAAEGSLDGGALYLVLVAGGIAAVVGANLVGGLGVRLLRRRAV